MPPACCTASKASSSACRVSASEAVTAAAARSSAFCFFRGFLLFLQRVQCGVAVILGTLGGGKCRIVGIFGGFLGAVQGILRSFQGSGGVFYGGLFFSVVRIAGIAGFFQSGSSFVPLGLGTGNALFTIGVDSVCFLVGTF